MQVRSLATKWMSTKNKTYYRNWYQQWREEEQLKLEQQTMNEVRSYQYTVDANQYRANHDLGRKNTGYTHTMNRKSQSPYQANKKRTQMADITLSGQNSFADVLRGILVGIPLVVVVLTVLYVGGILPQESVNQFLGLSTNNVVTDYINQYDELMLLHNEVNQSLSEHMSANNFSTIYLEELKEKQKNITTKTQELVATEGEEFSEMGRLLNLKLTSLNQLITKLEGNESVTEEVMQAYNQFVSDQNEVGNQIVLSLTNLLDTNKIPYTKEVNGAIKIK